MARKVLVQLVDDLDGKELGEDGQTVSFALDGMTYEIDLSGGNALKLRNALSKYVQSARKVGKVKAGALSPVGKVRSIQSANGDTKAIRAWAVNAGLMPENSRGRIPGEIVNKYNEAQSKAS